uniref:Uncharacterized protein n=1 Tax=Molossus molossus TaxID=27622 RepID=A0A7J8HIC3_MOLMO|nr:hypothetical protein HJG59_011047 [Molossus molossus]
METNSCCDITKTDWLVERCLGAGFVLLTRSTQSCSLGPVPKLLDNSLAPDSHSSFSPCHYPSHFQHSCQQPDKCVDFCLLSSLDLSSTSYKLSCQPPISALLCVFVLRRPFLQLRPAHCTAVSTGPPLMQTIPLAAKMLYFSGSPSYLTISFLFLAF